jgi:penicillin-binding protein 2
MELNRTELAGRQRIVGAIVLAVGLVFVFRLFQMQVTTDEWKNRAERLTEEQEVLHPSRGLCLDRHGELLVTNAPSYDLMVVPRYMAEVDTSALASLLGLEREELDARLSKARRYSRYKASPLLRQLNAEEYAKLSPELWRYPGLSIRTKPVRQNVHGIASQIVGEYREVDREDMNRDSRYRLGDYKGKSGIESQFELELRGTPGIRHHLVDVRNNVRNTLTELDSLPVSGDDVTLTLDLELQEYAEALMRGKRGAVVAIEPATGEILAFVSAPSYDGNLLTGTSRGAAYDSLSKHPWKPLYNRAVRGTYRPGSIFKMVQGLIAMQEGIISERTHIVCNRDIIGCHGAHTQDDLRRAIVHSCNPYFYDVMRRGVSRHPDLDKFDNARLGLGWWTERVKDFGLGTTLGGHIPGIRPGLVPDTTYYDNIYGKRHWTYRTIYSISIGEGELLATPLHMANLAAIMANRGWYMEPHLVRDIGGKGKPEELMQRHDVGVDAEHFEPVLDAMQMVIEDRTGTGRKAFTRGITTCGKTGTVQNRNKADHSVFMALAPRENPRIALSVYVENAGAGGDWAAPIAGLLVEKYIRGEVASREREARILGATYPLDPEFAEAESTVQPTSSTPTP